MNGHIDHTYSESGETEPENVGWQASARSKSQTNICQALSILVMVASWLMPQTLLAQDNSQVALVVRHGDGQVQSACVEFPESEISGLEVLQRADLDLEIDVQGMGALVCRINQTGCSVDDCWCQCKGGGDCVYWSYWHNVDNEWHYAQVGANEYRVRDGDVEGWSWGPGAVNDAVQPPDTTFSEICTESGTVAGERASQVPRALAPQTSLTASDFAAAPFAFGIIVIALAGMLLYARQRRHGQQR